MLITPNYKRNRSSAAPVHLAYPEPMSSPTPDQTGASLRMVKLAPATLAAFI